MVTYMANAVSRESMRRTISPQPSAHSSSFGQTVSVPLIDVSSAPSVQKILVAARLKLVLSRGKKMAAAYHRTRSWMMQIHAHKLLRNFSLKRSARCASGWYADRKEKRSSSSSSSGPFSSSAAAKWLL